MSGSENVTAGEGQVAVTGESVSALNGGDQAGSAPVESDRGMPAQTGKEPPLATAPGKGKSAFKRKQLRAAYGARFGVSLALVAVMTSLGSVAFSYFNFLRPYLVHATVGLGVLSLALYCFRFKRSDSELTEQEILSFYHDPGYWSFVVIVTAVFIYGLCTTVLAERKKGLMAPAPKDSPPAVVMAPVEFPQLHVTGLVVNGANSSAVINRQTVHLGEMIEGVKVEEIHPDGVVVELARQRKTFLLGVLPDNLATNTTNTRKATGGDNVKQNR